MDAPIDFRLEGLEQNEKHDRREHCIQIHRAKAADIRDEYIENTGEREGERCRDEQTSRELIKVGETRTRKRLGEHEEEHDREHRADRWKIHAEKRDEVSERERHGERANACKKSQSIANRTRRALIAATP